MYKFTSFMVIAALFTGACHKTTSNLPQTASAEKRPEIHFVPNVKAAGYPDMFADGNGSKWLSIRSKIDILGVYSEVLRPPTPNFWTINDFLPFGGFRKINEVWAKKFSMEMPVLQAQDPNSGIDVCEVIEGKGWLLAAEQALDRVEASGSHIDVFKLDEPLFKTIAAAHGAIGNRPDIIAGQRIAGGKTCEELGYAYNMFWVANQVVRFMKSIRDYAVSKSYPIPKFIAVEAAHPWFKPATLATYQYDLMGLAHNEGIGDLYLGIAIDSGANLRNYGIKQAGFDDYLVYQASLFDVANQSQCVFSAQGEFPEACTFIPGRKYLILNSSKNTALEYRDEVLTAVAASKGIVERRRENGLAGLIFQSWLNQASAEGPAFTIPHAFDPNQGEDNVSTHLNLLRTSLELLGLK